MKLQETIRRILREETKWKKISNLEAKKKVVFKYWGKKKPEIDDLLFTLVGEKKYVLPFWDIVRIWFVEYLGYDKVKQIANSILVQSQKESIEEGDCGTYNFDWKFVDYKIENSGSMGLGVYIYVSVAEDGYFTSIETGELITFKDLFSDNNQGILYEVLDEISGCIEEKLINNGFTDRTGIEIRRIMIKQTYN